MEEGDEVAGEQQRMVSTSRVRLRVKRGKKNRRLTDIRAVHNSRVGSKESDCQGEFILNCSVVTRVPPANPAGMTKHPTSLLFITFVVHICLC